MASNLDKFGVVIPNGGQSRGPMRQPKPKYRFRVVFIGFGNADDGNMITLDTNNVGAPTISHENVTVHSYNSSAHYKGKYTISTVEVTFRDTIGNLSLKALYNQMRREFNYYSQESRTSASQYKFTMMIQSLDGSNSENVANLYQGTLHTWLCEGCFIVESNFGDWDYSSSEPQNISLTIQPDSVVALGPQGEALGDSVSGNGTPEHSSAITSSQVSTNANTLPDSNFYTGQ